ncbi:MAG: ABC transporter substrate-binding protein [Acidimicrobiales bacterium]|jgi:ABC-type branched-subunit amino acid transport system substrate-binding protein|nr:ABC transporter substrate-binding protein [Acidimicrobiales bacterium]
MRYRRTVRLAAVAMALGLVAAGCRGSDDESSGTTSDPGSTQEVTPGVGFDGTNITLGVLTPQTGAAAVLGNPLTKGNEVFWSSYNEAGGVAGKYQVKLNILDTKYEPQTAVQQYQASKASVAAYQQVLGTPTVDALLPQLTSDNVLAGPASLDAFWVRETNLMPIGGPYQVQVINGMDYAIRTLDAKNKKVCALTKDDPYGETGLEGLEYSAEEEGYEIVAEATFKTGETNYTAPISQLKSAGCELTLLVALPNETSPILSEAVAQAFAPQWLAVSPTWVSVFAQSGLAPYLQTNFTLIAEGPAWGDTSVPGMAKMMDDIAKYAPDQQPDIYFQFGYAQAWAMAQILEQAVTDGDLSPAGIVAAAQKIPELTFEDLSGNYTYGPTADRNPPRTSSVFSIDPATPGGLSPIETNFTSSAAESFTFAE